MRKLTLIGILLILIEASVVSGFQINSNPQPLGNGWLYVGGTGEGNYTRIQDAIDNASDGDTVFVYNGTYYENIMIHKKINLTGEKKETTIIEGTFSDVFIRIRGDGVTVTGFTIQNALDIGIIIQSNHVKIHNNIINNSWIAVAVASCSGIVSDTTISNNTLSNDECGIIVSQTQHLHIINNTLTYLEAGLMLWMTQNTVIQSNSITVLSGPRSSLKKNLKTPPLFSFLDFQLRNDSLNSTAICSFDDTNVYIENNVLQGNDALTFINSTSVNTTQNTILFTNFPLLCFDSQLTITKNNILGKTSFNQMFIGIIDTTIRMNGNYWNRPRLLPKILLGYRTINEDKVVLKLFVDWRPALKAYDLP